jgi:ABC-2 type transport system permease protein
MPAIARSEPIPILRNRLILVTGPAIPVAVSAYLVHQHEIFSDRAGLGDIAAIVSSP